MDTTYILGLPIKREIDVGHFLTFLTLLAGFAWWLFTTFREWRRTSRKEAESGSLRLLLWLLREREGDPISLKDLKDAFNAPTLRRHRLSYCKRNYLFKTDEMFERAIYQLDWEGKVDFVGAQSIAFRIDRRPEEAALPPKPLFVPTPQDRTRAFEVFQAAFQDVQSDTWKLRDTTRTSFALSPDQTAAFLRAQMASPDPKVARLAVDVLGELVRG